MKRVLCWSAGKDSTASGILAKLRGEHIDEIISVMPDPFKDELALLKKFEEFMGMPVTLIQGPLYEDYFFRKKVRGKYVGTIYGWPFVAYKTCARVMKWEPMQRYCKKLGKVSFILGIAKGEQRNILAPNESLLLKYGLTEDDAWSLCEQYGLLNPLYKHFKRLGCVRCPKQTKQALLKVKELEPEKYQWCLDNDHLSPVLFNKKKSFVDLMEVGE